LDAKYSPGYTAGKEVRVDPETTQSVFSTGDQVVFEDPSERDKVFVADKIERYGQGPYTVVSVTAAPPRSDHPQFLALRTPDGGTMGDLWSGAWFKKIASA
jgi:hypothetical protein